MQRERGLNEETLKDQRTICLEMEKKEEGEVPEEDDEDDPCPFVVVSDADLAIQSVADSFRLLDSQSRLRSLGHLLDLCSPSERFLFQEALTLHCHRDIPVKERERER